MTAGVATRAARGTGAAPRGQVWIIVTLSAVAALVLRALWLIRAGHLLGVTEADDGVLFGNALRLSSGVIPYRDFSDVQPPGSFLLMAPVALLAKLTGSAWGLAIARLLTVGADVACVVVLGRLVRHRGLLAVAVACGGYAVYPDALVASRTFLLEPWLNLLCLLGALAVFSGDRPTDSPRRLLLGGLAFGFGAAVKLWAALPVAVLLVLLLPWRRSARFGLGAVAGFAIPVLPFFLLAPGPFVSGVITGQFNRSDAGFHQVSLRISDLVGVPGGLVLAGLLAVLALVGFLARRPAPLEVYALTCAVGAVVMLVLPRLYYPHYGSFAGVYLVLVIALALGRLGSPDGLGKVGRLGGVGRGAVAGGVAVVLVVTGIYGVVRPVRTAPMPSVAVASRLIPAGACVVTDAPSFTVTADRFTATGPCPTMVDAQGTLIAMTNGMELRAPPPQRAKVAALWLDAFAQARYVWLLPGTWSRIPWTGSLRQYLHAHFRLIAFASMRLWGPGAPESGLYARR